MRILHIHANSNARSDRSYAEEVRNEMTKPKTVPRTVNIWEEMASEWLVIFETSVTTGFQEKKQIKSVDDSTQI